MERLSPTKRLLCGLTGLTALITGFTFVYESTNQQNLNVSKETLVVEATELLGVMASGAVILKSIGDIMEEHYNTDDSFNLNNSTINIEGTDIDS